MTCGLRDNVMAFIKKSVIASEAKQSYIRSLLSKLFQYLDFLIPNLIGNPGYSFVI